MEYNTIRLVKGTAFLTGREYKKFTPGDTIWGDNSEWEEVACWSISDKKCALEELGKCKNVYRQNNGNWDITEYALEYFESDENGEFVSGSDYNLAEEEE